MGLIDGAFDVQEFFTDLAQELDYKFAADNTASNIVEFLENEVDVERWLGKDGKLTDRQMTLLKIYDGLPLNDQETALVQAWKALDRTTYDFEIGPMPRQALVLECGRSGGKCAGYNSLLTSQSHGIIYLYEILNNAMGISRDSYINTQEGLIKLATDNDLIGKALPIKHTVAIEGAGRTAESSHVFIKGVEQTRKITTQCGYTLEATPEHRIKVINSEGNIVWKYFAGLEAGDFACIHRSTQLFPSEFLSLDSYAPDPNDYVKSCRRINTSGLLLNEDFGYLLGLLTANGSWTVPTALQLTFHRQDTETYWETLNKIGNLLGLSDLVSLKNERSLNGCHVTLNSKILRKLFDNLGFTVESRVNNKKTPWSIRQSPKSVQASYLSGLFDGDGCVEKGGRSVTFSSASKTLAVETQLLLLNFGIVCNVREKIIKERPYYMLNLRGLRSLKMFASEIGFNLSRKQQPLEEYINNHAREKDETERIPHQINWLKRLRDTLPENKGQQPGSRKALTSYAGQELKTLRNYRAEYRAIVGNCIKENSGEHLSSYRLTKLVAFAEQFCNDQEAIDHFKYIQDCDYFYDPVISVEDSEAFCVDLSVPGHEQYVAQGMTNHNTFLGAIVLGYEWYKLCMLNNPQAFFGVSANTLISIYCLAPAASQVKKTIFGQARAFLNYIPKVKRLIDAKDIIVGEEEIKFPEKLLYIYAGNSKGASQVGSRVILLIMDEVARFENKDGDSNALELWSNIGVSGITFGKYARRVAISSAWCKGDAIERLWIASKSDINWIGFRFRTWDLNPAMGRDNPLILSEYNLNPTSARVEFEGDRSANTFSFFNELEVQQAFTGTTKALIEKAPNLEDGLVRLRLHEVEGTNCLTYMHLDPAFTGDAYGMAFGHGETIGGLKTVVIDGLAAWEPDAGNVVSIMNVYDIIYRIHNKRPIYKVTTDHAQQHETIQRLRMAGISAASRFWSNRVQVEIYDFTRKLLHEGRLILPKNSPWTQLLKLEMMGIVYDKEKGKIDHSPDSSKDLLDCVCSIAWEIAGLPDLKSNQVVVKPKNAGNLAGITNNFSSNLNDEEFGKGKRELVNNLRRGHFDSGGFDF